MYNEENRFYYRKEGLEMDAVKRWANERRIADLMKVLEDREFGVVMAQDKDDARKIVMDMIPEGSTIAVGGSVTLNETGILDEIRRVIRQMCLYQAQMQ